MNTVLMTQARHAQCTVVKALGDPREVGLVERHEQWPVPTHEVSDF
ncbi:MULTISPECIES: hypothetical protein [Halococcus]|nr:MULTISPECIES: hypothetical protein [Halococcus]